MTSDSQVLAALGIGPEARLGHGAEAQVFALDETRVARISRAGADPDWLAGRQALLAELAASADRVPFAIPTVLDTVVVAGRLVTIERRLPGQPLSAVLATTAAGPARAALIIAFLEAAAQIGNLSLRRSWYGDLTGHQPIRAESFRTYLAQRAARSLQAAGPAFAAVDPMQLAAALPEPDGPALVHLDAFPGNMLADAGGVTAVVDFGTVTIMGDRRLDPVTAALYLHPAITPAATAADRAVARTWLAARRLTPLVAPVRRWIAAFWSFAADDAPLHRWCRSILLAE